jgi:DNA polymerase III epsilon subunit family exonuclease
MTGLDSALRDLQFVAFDTETTGLVPAHERIVELSGVRFTLDGEISTFESLVDPGRPIPAVASRVHGIRDEDVRGQPEIGPVLDEFARFVADALLLAHNAEFDVGFVVQEAARTGRTLPRVPIVDTVEISRRVRSDLPNHKLETLSKALGCAAPTYHRALADSQTLMNCFRALAKDGFEQGDLRGLMQATNGALTFGPDERLWMWLPPELAPIEEALIGQSKVTILYEPEGRRQETRHVVPRGWMRRPGATYLMAWCDRDRADRSFRLDWILRAQYAQASLF